MYHQTAVEYLGGCGYQSSLSQSPGWSSCLLSPHTLTLPSPPGTWGTDSPPLLPGVMVANVATHPAQVS